MMHSICLPLSTFSLSVDEPIQAVVMLPSLESRLWQEPAPLGQVPPAKL